YVAPQKASDTQALTYTMIALGPTEEVAAGANLTATLRISGDDWTSAPIYAATGADGRATITVPLPGWAALYKDPDMYLDVGATWQDRAGSNQIPLDLEPMRPLLSSVGTLASPSLNVAAVTEPQPDGSTRLRLVTLDASAQTASGNVLIQADAPSGERQFWSTD